MSADTAPAEMPGVEEIKDLLLRFHADTASAWRHERDGIASSVARAVLAIFAPILAEKERELAETHDAYQQAAVDSVALFQAAEARALAAEAALAAEREKAHYANGVAELAMKHRDAAEKQLKPLLRIAKIAQWMVKDLDTVKVAEHARDFPGSTGPRIGQTAARTRDLIAALQAAAAIRAQGE